MKKKRIFKLIFGLLLLTHTFRTSAQSAASSLPGKFSYETALDTISHAALYKILLPPELLAHCKRDLSDIRLLADDKVYTPYVLQTDLARTAVQDFHEWPILPASSPNDTTHAIRIGNEQTAQIQSLLFMIRNVADSRTYTLSGSDDGKKWYLIREQIEFRPTETGNAPYYTQEIGFPSSNYRYFRITPAIRTDLPLNILKAGISSTHLRDGIYQPTPDPVIVRIDSSNHHSYLRLDYPLYYFIDRLELAIKAPLLYSRQAAIFDTRDPSPVFCRIDTSHHQFALAPLKTNRLMIDIDNQDNQPLTISQIHTAQLQRSLLAWLSPGVSYRLQVGDSLITAPSYDLKYFIDSPGMEPAIVTLGPIRPIPKTQPKPLPAQKDYSAILLWSAIIIVLVLLIFLSVKMLKAVDNRHERK